MRWPQRSDEVNATATTATLSQRLSNQGWGLESWAEQRHTEYTSFSSLLASPQPLKPQPYGSATPTDTPSAPRTGACGGMMAAARRLWRRGQRVEGGAIEATSKPTSDVIVAPSGTHARRRGCGGGSSMSAQRPGRPHARHSRNSGWLRTGEMHNQDARSTAARPRAADHRHAAPVPTPRAFAAARCHPSPILGAASHRRAQRRVRGAAAFDGGMGAEARGTAAITVSGWRGATPFLHLASAAAIARLHQGRRAFTPALPVGGSGCGRRPAFCLRRDRHLRAAAPRTESHRRAAPQSSTDSGRRSIALRVQRQRQMHSATSQGPHRGNSVCRQCDTRFLSAPAAQLGRPRSSAASIWTPLLGSAEPARTAVRATHCGKAEFGMPDLHRHGTPARRVPRFTRTCAADTVSRPRRWFSHIAATWPLGVRCAACAAHRLPGGRRR